MDPTTVEALKWLGGALMLVLAGAAGVARAGRSALPPGSFAEESAKDLIRRAEERMKEYHGLRDEMQGLISRGASDTLRLGDRVDRCEKDIETAKNEFGKELAKIEKGMRTGFAEINRKLDQLRDGGPIRRRQSDNDEEEENG